MQGTFSGGTAASLTATMKNAAKNPGIIKVLNDPFRLTPGFEGPDQPAGMMPHYEDELGKWAAPFIMATINTKNVHRTNFLRGHPYGEDFRYDEMMLTSPGEAGQGCSQRGRPMLKNPFGAKPPKPGEGPTKKNARTASTMCCSSANGKTASGCTTASRANTIRATARPAGCWPKPAWPARKR